MHQKSGHASKNSIATALLWGTMRTTRHFRSRSVCRFVSKTRCSRDTRTFIATRAPFAHTSRVLQISENGPPLAEPYTNTGACKSTR
jgi:hypothetical protein